MTSFTESIPRARNKHTLDEVLIQAGILQLVEEYDAQFVPAIAECIPDNASHLKLWKYLQELTGYLLLKKTDQIDVSQQIEEQLEKFQILGLDRTGQSPEVFVRRIQSAIDKMFPDIGKSNHR